MTDDDLVRRLLVGACAQNDVAWSLMRAAADRIKALTAEHNATLARLAGAVAREIALTAERDRLRGADVTQSCIICTGSGRVKVGISFPPKSTIAVKVEYDPCPGCTPPPHTFHAKLVAARLQEMRAALKGETP